MKEPFTFCSFLLPISQHRELKQLSRELVEPISGLIREGIGLVLAQKSGAQNVGEW